MKYILTEYITGYREYELELDEHYLKSVNCTLNNIIIDFNPLTLKDLEDLLSGNYENKRMEEDVYVRSFSETNPSPMKSTLIEELEAIVEDDVYDHYVDTYGLEVSDWNSEVI